jgi:hypothetical protein
MSINQSGTIVCGKGKGGELGVCPCIFRGYLQLVSPGNHYLLAWCLATTSGELSALIVGSTPCSYRKLIVYLVPQGDVYIRIYLYIHFIISICLYVYICVCIVVVMGGRVGDGRVGGWVGGSVSGWTLGVWVCGLCAE